MMFTFRRQTALEPVRPGICKQEGDGARAGTFSPSLPPSPPFASPEPEPSPQRLFTSSLRHQRGLHACRTKHPVNCSN